MRWLVPVLFPATLATAQDPGDAQFRQLLDAILPSVEERQWSEVPWRPELRTAIVEANEREMPVLLWAMNGHPLGQT